MSDVELEAYLNRYYEENPKEKEFYDMAVILCVNVLCQGRQ